MAVLGRRKKQKLSALVLAAAVVAAMVLPPAAASAQDDGRLQLNEQAIKTGLIYNFLKYTTWPESAPRLQVCLFGSDPRASYLAQLEGQTAHQAVIALVRKDRPDDTADCSVVFVDPGQRDSLPELLAFLKDRHILTISDMDRFASMGGMVELAMEDRRIVLYINQEAVNRAGLNIQSRLLKLAKRVSG